MRTKVRRSDIGLSTNLFKIRRSDIGLSTNLFFDGGVIYAAAVRIPLMATACLKGGGAARVIEPETAM